MYLFAWFACYYASRHHDLFSQQYYFRRFHPSGNAAKGGLYVFVDRGRQSMSKQNHVNKDKGGDEDTTVLGDQTRLFQQVKHNEKQKNSNNKRV